MLLFFVGFLGISNIHAQVVNAGVGGNSTVNLLKRLDTDVLQQAPDLVILMVGTNDMLNSKKMIPYKTYEDNLQKIVQKISDKGAAILLISPPPVDSVYLFERHDRKMFTEVPNVKLDTVRQITVRIAKKHELKHLDLYKVFSEMNLPKHNKDLFFRNSMNSKVRDGVHPTVLGYHFIGELVFHCLKENKLLKAGKKIVCFGDSITNGAGTKNKGTSVGDNYPAVLSRLILEYFEDE
ncbi:hypothetical protein AAY42_08720 [Flagellimonas eckloniae]|uniref:SGNH hydrolase-type esterase domain-containing protein n=1 Tax=Flagellimonas eckloniae TaxID=346185 RepID=A0A0Q1BLT1_9FLAO|nr:hypothetical protein AAY42_08720 [Allomuricauda eckloniae]